MACSIVNDEESGPLRSVNKEILEPAMVLTAAIVPLFGAAKRVILGAAGTKRPSFTNTQY